MIFLSNGRRVLVALVAFALGGCSAASSPDDGEGGAGSTDDATGQGGALDAVGTGVGGAGTGSGSGGGSKGCTAAAELIYVLSVENDLYSFRPDLKQFKKIGPLSCNTTMTPNSMAIDRDAVAWVN